MSSNENENLEPDAEDTDPDTPEAVAAAAAQAAADAAADAGAADDPVDVVDEAAEEAPEEPAADPVKVLAARVQDLESEVLRAVAETENVRKRGERNVVDAHKFAVSSFAKDLLSVADNLQRALAAVPTDRRGESDLVDNLLTGVEAVERELLATFQRHNIEKIEPLDAPFDPNFHQAMFEVPNSGKPNGTIVQLLQPGYILHGRLLRPAMVGVAKGDGPTEHKVDTTA